MTTFIIRVQLSNGSDTNYTRLRNALVQAGCTKEVVSKTDVAYILPNGNYLAKSEKNSMEILDVVQRIAAKIDRNPMIVVTEAAKGGIAWAGLPKAR